MTLYSDRRKRVLSLAKGAQVVAATAVNMFYLTDFFGGGVALVHPEKTVIFTSPLEVVRASELGKEVEVVKVRKWSEIPKAVTTAAKGEVVVDEDSAFRKSKRFKMRPECFVEARRTKDQEEVKRIAKASEIIDGCYGLLEREMKPGMTENEVAGEVVRYAVSKGATMSGSESSLSPLIIASGPNGALPHSELTGRVIRGGELVVADIFFRYLGYNSDCTRTFAVGEATGEMKGCYAAVKEAQEAAMSKMGEGILGGSVNAAAVAVLERHGLAKYLNHSVGHGVGIDIHEAPGIFKGSKIRLSRNDVVTDEPGVYLQGKFGVRIEDTVRIAGERPDVLTRYTKDLVTVG